MNQKNKKGFTLIELLVVIAIVGILSGVILVNLSGESDKASNARIKADMAQLRTAMESNRVSNASLQYGDPDTIGATLIADMTSTTNGGTSWKAENSTSAWCAQIVLKGTGAGSWCVDSSGYAGTTAACDSSTFDCATD